MAKIAKHQRRAVRRQVRNLRQSIADGTPERIRRAFAPVVNYAEMLLVDHGVFRLFYQNCHRLGREAWRSAQPAPHQIRHLARQGIRTIVNLRGERYCGSYWLEREACERHGIRLENFTVRSRAAPAKEDVLATRDFFHSIEYPMLMHCKSGADRAGLMSALYLIVRENVPVATAAKQLSLRFGHIRQADTGILDHFFERYLEANAERPIGFFDWVEHVYDPEELKRSFAARSWANVLVNGVLRRE
ncbi:MAG TPA: sulfur transferase domain-containing protein [Hyphomicrobiaceae bacterium]|nr:sulfur transferase domain-containing protein [Hyphomicrobiaceae bacterium]